MSAPEQSLAQLLKFLKENEESEFINLFKTIKNDDTEIFTKDLILFRWAIWYERDKALTNMILFTQNKPNFIQNKDNLFNYAVHKNKAKVVNLFLQLKTIFDPTIKDLVLLKTAVKMNHDRIVQMFLNDTRVLPDNFIFSIAVVNNSLESLKVLISNKKINAGGDDSLAFKLAVKNNNIEIIKTLAKDQNTNIFDNKNYSLQLALKKQFKDVFAFLLEETARNQSNVLDFLENLDDKKIDLILSFNSDDIFNKIKEIITSKNLKNGSVSAVVLKKLEECEKIIKVEYPPEWGNGPFNYLNDDFYLVTLDPNSNEFKTIQEKFIKNSKGYRYPTNATDINVNEVKNVDIEGKTYKQIDKLNNKNKQNFDKKINKIERVQNPKLWYNYYQYLKMLTNKYDSQHQSSNVSIFEKANEWWVKHGSHKTSPEVIAKKGIDYRYSKHGNLYGKGAYTTANANYSDGPYSYNIEGTNLKQMFLCRVAAGTMYFENESIIKNKPPDNYDSILGNAEWYGKFYDNIVTYHKDSVYPAYLITYGNETEKLIPLIKPSSVSKPVPAIVPLINKIRVDPNTSFEMEVINIFLTCMKTAALLILQEKKLILGKHHFDPIKHIIFPSYTINTSFLQTAAPFNDGNDIEKTQAAYLENVDVLLKNLMMNWKENGLNSYFLSVFDELKKATITLPRGTTMIRYIGWGDDAEKEWNNDLCIWTTPLIQSNENVEKFFHSNHKDIQHNQIYSNFGQIYIDKTQVIMTKTCIPGILNIDYYQDKLFDSTTQFLAMSLTFKPLCDAIQLVPEKNGLITKKDCNMLQDYNIAILKNNDNEGRQHLGRFDMRMIQILEKGFMGWLNLYDFDIFERQIVLLPETRKIACAWSPLLKNTKIKQTNAEIDLETRKIAYAMYNKPFSKEFLNRIEQNPRVAEFLKGQQQYAPEIFGSDVVNEKPYPWSNQTGSKRIMSEFLYLKQKIKDGDNLISNLELVDESNVNVWNLELKDFDETIPGGKDINNDLNKLKKDKGQDHIKLEITFPDDYPNLPFRIRVVSPRMKMYSGHVTDGGSICIQALTTGTGSGYWTPSYSVESMLMLIKITMISVDKVNVKTPNGQGEAGPLRIDLDKSTVMLPYSKIEADNAFNRMVVTHKLNGW